MSAPGGRANTLAWLLSVVVIVAGVVAWLATDRPLFLVFTGLGLLTVVNVIVYDRMVLRRKPNQTSTATPSDTPTDGSSAEAPSPSTTRPEQGESAS